MCDFCQNPDVYGNCAGKERGVVEYSIKLSSGAVGEMGPHIQIGTAPFIGMSFSTWIPIDYCPWCGRELISKAVHDELD